MKENKETVTIEIDDFILERLKEFQVKRKRALFLRKMALDSTVLKRMDVFDLLKLKEELIEAEEDCRTYAVILCEHISGLI